MSNFVIFSKFKKKRSDTRRNPNPEHCLKSKILAKVAAGSIPTSVTNLALGAGRKAHHGEDKEQAEDEEGDHKCPNSQHGWSSVVKKVGLPDVCNFKLGCNPLLS